MCRGCSQAQKVKADGQRSDGNPQGSGEVFDRHRPLLFSIAYRMVGSVIDAEDVVQEAYLRWRRSPQEEEIRSPKSYLSAVVTRLCIDQLRSARARREEYVGPWLPEPLPTDAAVLDESLSMAFLVLLESLNPTERAIFLLREVFDYDYREISHLVDKSEENCRQIARRARQSVAARRPRFESTPEQEERLMGRFLEACFDGDMDGLLALLSEDVTLWSDGEGEDPRGAQPDPRCGQRRPVYLRDTPQGPARIRRSAGFGQRTARSHRLLRRWASAERRGLRRRRGEHQGHSPRGEPGEASGCTSNVGP